MRQWKSQITIYLLCCGVSLCLGCGSGDDSQKEVIFVEGAEDFVQISESDLNFSSSNRELGVTLDNNNSEAARWTASTDAAWIQLNPERGIIPPWGSMLLSVTVNRGLIQRSEGIGFIIIDIPTYGEKKHIRVEANG